MPDGLTNMFRSIFRRLSTMRFFSRVFAASVLAIASFGPASAATLFEDIQITYQSTIGFTFSNLSFTGPSLSNIFSTSPYAGSSTVSPSPGGVLADQVALLTVGATYNFTGHADLGGGHSFDLTGSIVAGPSFSSIFAGGAGAPFSFALVQGAVSPVPLPASLPLFALALISLGALGYHASRAKRRIPAQTGEMLATVA
jgi:hypothetical protein